VKLFFNLRKSIQKGIGKITQFNDYHNFKSIPSHIFAKVKGTEVFLPTEKALKNFYSGLSV
jgi:hypothetical protein